MPYGQVTTPSATLSHVHSSAVGQGGPLTLNTTLIGGFTPLSLVVALG